MLSLANSIKLLLSNDKNYGITEKNRDTITKLKFISTLQSGEKIDVKNLRVETNTILTPIKRMLFGESRDTTITFLNSTIERSFEIIQAYCYSDKKSEQIFCSNIILDLAKCIEGLQNLQKTYKEDNLFVCNIDTIIENIKGKLIELKERFPSLFREDYIIKVERNDNIEEKKIEDKRVNESQPEEKKKK